MKLSPFVIGVISAQGSGDYDYGADDDRHVYGGSSSYSSSFGGSSWNYGSASGRTSTPATAVTCWESNNMGTHGTLNGAHNNHLLDSVDQFGWANTHHGHDTSQGTINVVGGSPFDGANTHDYHSEMAFDHRLSGCIYETTGWNFDANTYNKVHTMVFGGGFSDAYDGTNSDIFPVWWHYFNAHVLLNNGAGTTGNIGQHDIVMANPTYEGLGYLNFIVTFLKGDGSNAIVEKDPSTNEHNTNNARHTDLYANGDAFQLGMRGASTSCGYSDLAAGSGCYASKYPTTNNAGDTWSHLQFAASSFPHNDLGKDFRFNLRMMHHLGEGDSNEFFDSYYFYRVNTIVIQFPTTVSCPHTFEGTVGMHQCMDSAGSNGHKMHDYAFGTPNNQLPAYTEMLEDDNNKVAGGTFSLICDNTSPFSPGSHACGDKYTVNGLMNMYDEYAQQEYGTHQELWFQFYYKYEGGSGDLVHTETGLYNFPNKLFNAFEITSASGSCNTSGVYNANKCNGGDSATSAEETWSENVQSGR
jgi:hypothetical protein